MTPTQNEINSYGLSIGLNEDDCESFYDYHETRGWVTAVGKVITPIKSWKGAMRTWKRNKNKWERERNGQRTNAENTRSYTVETAIDYAERTRRAAMGIKQMDSKALE